MAKNEERRDDDAKACPVSELGSAPDAEDQPSLGRALFRMAGGIRGVIETGLPGVIFALVFALGGHNLGVAVLASVGSAALLLVLRLVRKDTPAYAVMGFAGVLLAGGFAWATGQPEDYFLPGIVINSLFAVFLLVSILVRRPVLGYLLALVQRDPRMTWMSEPPRLRAYAWATGAWMMMYAVRAVGRGLLYLSGDVLGLAVFRFLLDWPLLIATLGATYLFVRKAPLPKARQRTDEQSPAAGGTP